PLPLHDALPILSNSIPSSFNFVIIRSNPSAVPDKSIVQSPPSCIKIIDPGLTLLSTLSATTSAPGCFQSIESTSQPIILLSIAASFSTISSLSAPYGERKRRGLYPTISSMTFSVSLTSQSKRSSSSLAKCGCQYV